MADFRLPDVGEGLTEAEILTWKVAVGDEVRVNDILVDIETAKSIVELPSPFVGVVAELLVAEGETVEVGTAIVRITEHATAAEPGDSAAPAISEGADVPGEVPAATQDSESGPEGGVLVGYGPRNHQVRRRRRGAPEAPPAPVETDSATEATATARLVVLAKPPVRKFAKDVGVGLNEVPHEGRCVTRADVEAWILDQQDDATTSASPRSPLATSAGARHESVSAVRRATAAAMVASAFTAPHVTEWLTVDVSESVKLVDTMRKDPAFDGVSTSIMVLAARAVCLALRRQEIVHAQWADSEIVYPEHVGLGIATATDRGLLVPVVPAAETLSTPDLAREIQSLVDVARAGRLQPEQMAGGTFTITNVGVFGIDGGTPILPPGQTGILALGTVSRRPWVDAETDEIVARWVMTLALSFDHRVVDGEQASRFLVDVARLLENPALAATF